MAGSERLKRGLGRAQGTREGFNKDSGLFFFFFCHCPIFRKASTSSIIAISQLTRPSNRARATIFPISIPTLTFKPGISPFSGYSPPCHVHYPEIADDEPMGRTCLARLIPTLLSPLLHIIHDLCNSNKIFGAIITFPI
jgi:hypothetical protein